MGQGVSEKWLETGKVLKVELMLSRHPRFLAWMLWKTAAIFELRQVGGPSGRDWNVAVLSVRHPREPYVGHWEAGVSGVCSLGTRPSPGTAI